MIPEIPLSWWLGAVVTVVLLWMIRSMLTRDFDPPLSSFQYSGTRQNVQAIFYAWPQRVRLRLKWVLYARFVFMAAWSVAWAGMVIDLAQKAAARQWLISDFAPAVVAAVGVALALAFIENTFLCYMVLCRSTRFARLSSLAAEYKIIVLLAVGAYVVGVAYAVLVHWVAGILLTLFS